MEISHCLVNKADSFSWIIEGSIKYSICLIGKFFTFVFFLCVIKNIQWYLILIVFRKSMTRQYREFSCIFIHPTILSVYKYSMYYQTCLLHIHHNAVSDTACKNINEIYSQLSQFRSLIFFFKFNFYLWILVCCVFWLHISDCMLLWGSITSPR